jgi:hypothetical protein
MKDKDYKMLEEAYTKIKEARSFGGEPWHNEEQWDHDKEWHGLSAKTPKDIDPKDLMNPDFSKGESDIKDDSDELTDDLTDVIQKYEEMYGTSPTVQDLAISFARIVQQYGSHNKEKFLNAIKMELSKE